MPPLDHHNRFHCDTSNIKYEDDGDRDEDTPEPERRVITISSDNSIQRLNNLLAEDDGELMEILRDYTSTQQLSIGFDIDVEYRRLGINVDFQSRSILEFGEVRQIVFKWLEKHKFHTYLKSAAKWKPNELRQEIIVGEMEIEE